MIDTTVGLVQLDPAPGNRSDNLRRIERHAKEAARQGAQLIVCPELATTGGDLGDRAAEVAEPLDGPTVGRVCALAATTRAYVAVGLVEADGATLYNSLVLAGPRGDVWCYRKRHVSRAERLVFTPGTEPVVAATSIGRIGLTLGYDLLRPAAIAALAADDVDLVVTAARWQTDPWQASHGWTGTAIEALCRTRALETSVHLAMATTVGAHGSSDAIGHSTVASPTGVLLVTLGDDPGVATTPVRDPTVDLERWRSLAGYLDLNGSRRGDDR